MTKQNPRRARILESRNVGKRTKANIGLVQVKLYFHADLHIDRFTILQSRLEFPLLHGFECFRVESETESANHSNVPRMAGGVDDEPEHARALLLRVARFFGVIRIG